MKAKLSIFILVVVMILSSCSNIVNTSDLNDENSKVIVDSMDREVRVPLEPQRVACLFTNTGHIMTMLGSGDKIVAVSNGLKRDKLLHEIAPSIKEAALVKVSGAVNFEELLKQNVDLVIMPSDMYADDALVKQFNKYKIPFIVTQFDSIETQQDLVMMLGEVFNAQEEAALYNAMYDEIRALVNDCIKDIPAEQRLRVYHALNEATNTVPLGSLPEEFMKISGGLEVSLKDQLIQDNDKYYASLEQIIAWNPEVIFCNEDGVDQYILEKDQWQMIDAVKNHRVYIMPTGISRWGHTTSIETPLAMMWVAKTLYPEACETLDLKAYTQAFYRDLFEYELTDEAYDSIIDGRGMRLNKDLSDQGE
ncbi:ABC transporter substrate-binding protein [Fusibacter ferrireducens]|uniref:ABC transporter substrate-binding protein n=1 Tax=Fusibacter ferrireducens TaxID=2785058 RepID=A0ABR9ZRW9_9FIRM|nr:ABC transporter substrate-binding protein [Fusibacter ferrireducens]MBF4692374.1 ABC transporter substrate-binding protein [Fusibacter ferrireducens]